MLPPERLAAWLAAGLPHETRGDVELGVWILKGALLAVAALLEGLGRMRFPLTALAPLVHAGDAAAGLHAPVRASRREAFVLAVLLLVALVLRLRALGEGLWFDEIWTLDETMRKPLGELIATFQSSNQHVLFSLLAKGSLSALGESAWALRLPGVLLGVASVGALYWLGTLVTSRREALLATALLAVSYHHVWFSQNARGYTSLLLWTLLGSGIFLRALSARDARGWAPAFAYGIAMALAIYTHLSAVIIVAAHGLVWLALVLQRRRAGIWPTASVPLVGLVLAGALSALLYAIALPQVVKVLLLPIMPGQDTAWKTPAWALAELVSGLTHGNPMALAVLGVGAIVGAAGAVSYARRHWSLAAVMLLPAMLTAAVLIAKGHNLWPRFFFFSAGFAILIAIRGVFALAPVLRTRHAPALATTAILLVIAASAATVPRAWRPKQDYEGARRFVESRRAPGDAVVMVDMAGFAYGWYLKPSWLTVETGDQLAAVEARHPRTWVLYIFPIRLAAVQPTTWARLQEHYRKAAEFPGTLGGGSIFVVVNQ